MPSDTRNRPAISSLVPCSASYASTIRSRRSSDRVFPPHFVVHLFLNGYSIICYALGKFSRMIVAFSREYRRRNLLRCAQCALSWPQKID
jgi:hypothetical protein